jgi:ubiquinone/menaquinone biosynthesis C-methylase UbiE
VLKSISDGAIASPNIWHHANVYEIENRAVDPDGILERAMQEIRPWRDAAVLDIGCGTGFHLPRFAASAASVVGVDPHPRLVAAARRRTRKLPHVKVRQGAAQRLPLPNASVDFAHARWAYFFGPHCAPGLRELARVVRRGGAAFLIDNDPTRSTFGRWFARAYPEVDPVANDEFFSRHGWQTLHKDIRWSFETRADLEAVVRIEFPRAAAERIIAGHPGLEVDYAVLIRHRSF